MSNRHLKRLVQQMGVEAINKHSSEIEIDVIRLQADHKTSVFQQFADTASGDLDADVDSIEDGDDEWRSTHLSAATKNLDTKSKKQKKKQNRRKRITLKQQDTQEDGQNLTTSIEKELHYIEDETQPVATPQNCQDEAIRAALSFHAKYLNPETEIRRRFGASVIRAEKQHVPKLTRRAATSAKTLLVPDAAVHYLAIHGRRIGGISMEPVTDREKFFEYKFSEEYWEMQAEFMLLVRSLSQDNLLSSLQRVTDHIDTLVQASEMLRAYEDRARAGAFVERALFILEKAWHSSFNFENGCCRLDYRCKPNRALFVALFLHAHYLADKGCPRTALEVCKLLLCLDPEHDPLAVLLVIDYFALRSEEYEWLVQFYNILQKARRNLSHFPNFAYSVALAHFHLSQTEKADKLLCNALTCFPDCLKAIVDKNSILMDRRTAAVFDRAASSDYDLLVCIYVERCAWMFKEPQVLRWVESVASRLVESGFKPKFSKKSINLPRNVLRHVTLAHLPGVSLTSQHIPIGEGANFDFDPFPPKDAYGDLTPDIPIVDVEDALSDATLINFLNSLSPTWTGQSDDGENTAASNVREGVSNLLGAMFNLMSNIARVNGNSDVSDPRVEGGDAITDISTNLQENANLSGLNDGPGRMIDVHHNIAINPDEPGPSDSSDQTDEHVP